MRKSIWSYLVAVLVVAVPLSAAGPGKSLREDAASYAAEVGVNPEEAARRLQLQRLAGDLDGALAEEESATFAGLFIEHKPSFRIVVRFTDRAAEERLAKRIAGGPLELLVETRPARVALAELEKQQKNLRSEGVKAGIEFESEIDVRSNRMNVYALDAEKFRVRLGHAVPFGTRLEKVDRLSVEQNTIYGGAPLYDCTAAFGVRHNTTGELGISTAAHCSNAQYFNGIYLPFVSGMEAQYQDVQWNSGCGRVTVTNQFQSGIGMRSVIATRSRTYQAAGQYVCKYGKTTGRSCGFIDTKHFDPGAGFEGTFVRVNDSNNGPGDSGGPWYDEDIALGIHKARVTSDGDAVYMPINYISALNVSVLTYNPGACTVPPVASFTYSESFGNFNFDASASYDPNGTIVSYAWDFGDGTYETNPTPYTSHWFDPWTEYYTVWLTVTDSEGATKSYSRSVRVCNGPGQMVCPY